MYAMNDRQLKDVLYEQVARVGKAFSSPKRLEILDMLAQSEKAVETITSDLGIDNKLASAHLKALKEANLVQTRRDGKRMFYRLAGNDVGALCMMMRQVADAHVAELQVALKGMVGEPDHMVSIGRKELMLQAKRGDVVVIDVRPHPEFAAAHLPYARSLPLPELVKRLSELPKGVEIVAYCRGPFCLMSNEAVTLLQAHGYTARKTQDGVSEWQAAGLPLSRPRRPKELDA